MISVIVPFYNSEQWLDRCCKSLSENEGDFEFILVNDQSTDNGEEIAYSWHEKDKRFLLVGNMHRKGVSGARNTGIDLATGEWITFLDADDEYLPDAYNTMRSVINADPRANIHQLNHMRYYTAIDKLVLKYTNKGGVYKFGNLPEIWWGVWNKIYRTKFLSDIRFNEELQYGEDGLFALETFCKDNYIHHGELKQCVIKHRFDNKQSLSHIKKSDDVHKMLKEYDALYEKQTDKIIKIDLAGTISDLWGHRLITSLKEE